MIETGTKEKHIAQYKYFIDNNSGEWRNQNVAYRLITIIIGNSIG
jgi:hypothetical protein